MKFTVVFITLLSIAWAVKVQSSEEKREAPSEYSGGHSGHSYAPSFSQEDAQAISIGAGYSIGGAKPSFSYGAPEGGQYQLSSEGLPSSGHGTIQLPPITLQPSQGHFASSDLSQLMSQLSQGLNSGQLQLSHFQGGEGGEGGHGAQGISIPQYSFGEPKQQQYSAPQQYIEQLQSLPYYAAGTKGLGSYSSTGPVLFSPSQSDQSHPGLSYGTPSGGHSFGDASGYNFGTGNLAALLGDSGHSFGGSSGHNSGGINLGDSGHSLGGSGYSLGGSGGHSFGGSIKHLNGGYVVPSKTSFKPSTYLGSHSDGGHSLAGLSGSHGAPSFVSHASSGGHGGLSLGAGSHGNSFGSSLGSFGGSSKFIAPSYLPPKGKGYGSSLDSVAAYTSNGHASPPRTTYGHPSSSFTGGPAPSNHGASSHGSQYYVSSSKFPSFGEGSSSFKGSSGHGSLSSSSSGPKYSFSGHSGPSSHYGASKDIQGSFSETSYNTIKYSEELKPRVH